MIRDHGRFKDLASGVQSIALTVALLAGAWWAVFTLEAQRARAEYQRLLAEIRDQRVVNVTVQASSVVDPRTKTRHLVAVVQMHNDGRTTEILSGPSNALRVTYVPLADSTARPTPIAAHFVQPPGDSVGGLRVMPGITHQWIFVAPTPRSGFYHLRFWIAASEPEQKQAREEGAPMSNPWLWGNDSYLVVR